MLRPLIALAATVMFAAPALAATYTAKPVEPAAQAKIVARDIVWTCGAEGCRGATSESRPAVLCQALAKRAGRLASFAVDGRAFASAELDRCNAAAPAGANETVAEAR